VVIVVGRQGMRMAIGVGRISLAGKVSCRFVWQKGEDFASRCRRTGMSENALHRQRRKAHTRSMSLKALGIIFCNHMCLVTPCLLDVGCTTRGGQKEHVGRQRVVRIRFSKNGVHTHVKENHHEHVRTHPMIHPSYSGTLRKR